MCRRMALCAPLTAEPACIQLIKLAAWQMFKSTKLRQPLDKK